MIIPAHIELKEIPNKGKGLISKKFISKDECVLKFNGGITIRPNSTASATAIQIDEDSFLDSNPKQIRDFLNHSCDPNVRIDFDMMCCIAVKDIKKGDEISYNYLSTEYDLKSKNEHFPCFCGSKNCVGTVMGFKYLSKKQKNNLKPLLIPYLLRKIFVK